MDLQTALGNSACTEIWVAKGVYTPTTAATPTIVDRAITFNVLPGVKVYGGFAGGETLLSARDPATNVTILSGDIDANDTGSNHIDATSADIVGSNSIHVLSMDGTTGAGVITASTVLDGFTITGGTADQAVYPDERGGGLFCNGAGSGYKCSPTLANLTLDGNRASVSGGALLNSGQGGASSPTLSNVSFRGNSASYGSAMYNDGYGGTSSPALSNVTFSGNNAVTSGGAIYNDGTSSGTSNPTFSNVILWNDTAAGSVSEIFNDSATATIDHSVIDGGCTSGDGNTCSNVLTADPLLGALADNGGTTQTLLPGAGSSAIEGGDDTTCLAAPVSGLDQRAVSRPQSAHCDIGAVEARQYTLQVSVSGSGSVDANPAAINGGIVGCTTTTGSCSATYPEQGTIGLTASADVGHHFLVWGGDCSASGSVTLDAAKTCTASFAIDIFMLTYNASAGGSITGTSPQTVNYGADGSAVTAAPNAGYHFVQWSDNVTTATRTDTNVTANINVTANFAINSFALSANVSGGHGSISPTSINADYGDTPTFTVTPDAQYHVASVSGCGGTLNGTTYTTAPITGPCTITASFAQAMPPSMPVPTLGRRLLLLLAGLLAATAMLRLRRG